MKGSERKTYRAVVESLNAEGKKNRSGGDFSISIVKTIYENKKVCQEFYRYEKQVDWVQGQHEAILTD